MLIYSERPAVAPSPTDPAGYEWEGGDALDVPDDLAAELLLVEGFRQDGLDEPERGETPDGHNVVVAGWSGVTRPAFHYGPPEDRLVEIVMPATVTNPSELIGGVRTHADAAADQAASTTEPAEPVSAASSAPSAAATSARADTAAVASAAATPAAGGSARGGAKGSKR